MAIGDVWQPPTLLDTYLPGPRMEYFVTTVADALMFVIVAAVLVSCLCALKVAFCTPVETRQAFNKHVVPGFPCEGTLFVLARDGVMYAVPRDKAVVRTDMVRELHHGQVVRGCDRWGHCTYVEDDYEEREHGREESEHGDEEYEHEEHEEHEQTPGTGLDHINADWSVGSVRSQAMTLSMSGDNSCPLSPPRSPLVGESMTASPIEVTI